MPDTHDDDSSRDESGPFRDNLRSQLVTAGTAAAEQWLAIRANRKMSDVNRKRLAGHVVNALWNEIERAVLEMAQYVGDEQLAAATARAEKAEAEVAEFREPTEWGRPRTEWTWSARKPDGVAVPPTFPDPHPPRTEETLRREFDGVVNNMGYRKVLLRREVTAWRDADAAPNDQATETEKP